VDSTDSSGEWQDTLTLLKQHEKQIWMIVNKIDLNPNALLDFSPYLSMCQQNFFISAKTGDGIGSLIEALVEDVAKKVPEKGEVGEIITNERHRDCLRRAEAALSSCVEGAHAKAVPLAIVAADLREALGALDEIVGKTYTEDILGRIFSKFCIGK
jgi:tRNA modification GTPase